MNAVLWEAGPAHGREQNVRCLACAHSCLLPPGETGLCGVRANDAGQLRSRVSGGIVSAHADPVEKKPLYHYLPGTRTFSFGTEGCNFRCAFCQNADISQHPRLTGKVRQQAVTSGQLVRAARQERCASIAFTYTEPTVFIELMLETASLARASGLGTVMVSNGFQSPATLEALRPHIQAVNIDLKSMRPDFYTGLCNGRLEPVLDNLKRMRSFGWWLEVTTLIIPGLNDSHEELRRLAGFLANELGADTPWHVSAFHPAFAMTDRPATPPQTIDAACALGYEAGLRFVYPGNVQPAFLHADKDTRCPECGTRCVSRRGAAPAGFSGMCPACGFTLAGVWSMPSD